MHRSIDAFPAGDHLTVIGSLDSAAAGSNAIAARIVRISSPTFGGVITAITPATSGEVARAVRVGQWTCSVYPPLLACLLVAGISLHGVGAAPSGAAPVRPDATSSLAGRLPRAVFSRVAPARVPLQRTAHPALDMPNETLVRDTTSRKIELIWAGVRYQFNSSASLTALGFAGGTVLDLADAAVQAVPRGPNGRPRLAHGLVYPLSPRTCGHP